jgi:aerobic-type carbon monoxide dehydrogenase small subunit (CoxS/CutS family)
VKPASGKKKDPDGNSLLFISLTRADAAEYTHGKSLSKGVPMADHELTDPGCSTSESNKISRRDVIKSVIATGVVSSTSYLFRVSKVWAQASAPGAVDRLITLNVNGQQRRVDVMKQETLVMTLRYKLGLTGTKIGCDQAECGACTVLIDDVPYYSCSVFTHTVRDKKIQTIEGLAKPDGALHPVQQGVIDEQGFQCAFCMSGFMMATVGFLKINPNPTRAELAKGISGNICRCQDYDKILTAMMRGAENLRKA